MNGIDLYSVQTTAANAAAQESINVTAPVAEIAPVVSAGSRFVSAGIGTLIFATFFVALLWGLGEMTGEALFRRVESAVS